MTLLQQCKKNKKKQKKHTHTNQTQKWLADLQSSHTSENFKDLEDISPTTGDVKTFSLILTVIANKSEICHIKTVRRILPFITDKCIWTIFTFFPPHILYKLYSDWHMLIYYTHPIYSVLSYYCHVLTSHLKKNTQCQVLFFAKLLLKCLICSLPWADHSQNLR